MGEGRRRRSARALRMAIAQPAARVLRVPSPSALGGSSRSSRTLLCDFVTLSHDRYPLECPREIVVLLRWRVSLEPGSVPKHSEEFRPLGTLHSRAPISSERYSARS